MLSIKIYRTRTISFNFTVSPNPKKKKKKKKKKKRKKREERERASKDIFTIPDTQVHFPGFSFRPLRGAVLNLCSVICDIPKE
jgi:hypothetical protein